MPCPACPTPNYDQIVYHYKHADDTCNFTWVVPSKEIVQSFYANKELVSPEDYDLLGFVISFVEGDLFRLAKKFNKEEDIQLHGVIKRLES